MMKKLLLSLIALVVGCCFANADELYKLQFGTDAGADKCNQYNATSKWQITCNNTVWDCRQFSNNNLGWPNARCGSNKNATTPYIVNNAAWDEQVTEIVINAQKIKSGAADVAASAKILVASDTAAISPAVTVDITSQINGLTTTASDITVAINGAPAGMFYKFVLECPKSTNNGWLAINSITYNGTTGAPKSDPQLKFAEDAYTATIGQTFASPKATQVGNGAITYSSSDTTIATVDANTGDVELVSGGECTITATSASTDDYNKGTASYVLTVVDPTIVYTGLENSDTGWTAEDIKLGGGLTYVWKWDATNKYYKGSSYASGTANEANSYLISPVIDLTGRSSATCKFVNQLNYLNGGNRSDFVNVLVREEGSTEWTVVEVDTWPAGTSWTAVTSNISLDAYAGKKIQLGFQYTVPAGSTIAPTWEVSKVVINGTTASAPEFVVYNNGTLGTGIVAYQWWNSTFDFNAANPDGTAKVMSFKSTDGGAAASMGLNSETPDFCGKLHNATLNFKYYAEGTGTYTIRLTSIAEENYSFTTDATTANSWQTVSLPVAEKFPTVASEWNENKKEGKGYVFSVILENGSSDAVIYFDNIYYSNIDETWEAPTKEYTAPTTVPVPTQAADDVMSVFSSAYDSVTTFNIGGWGQSTSVAEIEIAGSKVEQLNSFNYLGWELAQHIDISTMQYMHVDFYTCQANGFQVTPISPNNELLWVATDVKVNEWNSYDIPLSYFANVQMNDVFQIKFAGGINTNDYPCYIANVYFYKEDNGGEDPEIPEGSDSWGGEFSGTYSTDNESGTYVLSYWVKYNEPESEPLNKPSRAAEGDEPNSLYILSKLDFSDNAPTGLVAGQVYVNNKSYDLTVNSDGYRTATVTDQSFQNGQSVPVKFYIPYSGKVIEHTANYIVGKVNMPTDINEIEVDKNAEAVYYNLQGVRVDNPKKGIFVKVVNGKAVKVQL